MTKPSDEKTDAADGVDRRQFLKVLGVTGAGTAALSGCSTDRVTKLIPYLIQSEQQVPGVADYYASTCNECSVGCGLHVKTREARAIKLEGNPEHPVNEGTLCARGQAGLQALYNPDRIGKPLARNAAGGFDEIEWDDAIARLAAKLGTANGRVAAINGYGPSTFSTLLDDMMKALGGRTVSWEAFAREPESLANKAVFGRDDLPQYHIDAAEYIVSFGADFLETWGAPTEQARGFANAHGFHDGKMAKHVYVGPRMSLTAANADEWLEVPAGTEVWVALCLARAAAERSGSPLAGELGKYTPELAAEHTGLAVERLAKVADEFAAASPSLAMAGGIAGQHRGAIDLCRAANLANVAAGNIGKTVRFGPSVAPTGGYGAIRAAFDAMDRGDLEVVIAHEANPLYALPADGKFAAAWDKVPFTVSTSNILDETAAASDLVIPNLHSLERWDDLHSRAGVRGLMQPVMEPVLPGRHTGDVLLAVAQKVAGPLSSFTAASYEVHLRAAWDKLAQAHGAADNEEFWRSSLQRGGLFEAAPEANPAVVAGAAAFEPTEPEFDGDGEFTLVPWPSSNYYDGRGANKPWLLENPDSMTRVTWQSWVELHPDTARKVDVREGEIVEVHSPHGMVRAQVYVFPGIRPDTLGMPLGMGHTSYGRYATDRGFNALDVLAASDGQGFLPYVATKVSLTKTHDYRQSAKTEGHSRQLGRGIIEAMPLVHAQAGMTPKESMTAAGHPPHEVNTERELEAIDGWYEVQKERWEYGDYARDEPKWGMAVDLSRCTGCSACVTACYAENNIPTVGEDQVFRGREMSWMRIERYWEGGEDGEPWESRVAPVMCQHCDNAPCEPVCPVYAAYHTPDGLNGQVYNRCVGTRYCSNNCPFKVRYFNWLKYDEKAWPAPLNLQLNPEVTVRGRGVMEKCTFCIQRIRGAQHQAIIEGRELKTGEIMTACQQGCPSHAIRFGNVHDPNESVLEWRRDPRGYTMLEETNVRPQVTYLAKVRAVAPVGHGDADESTGEGR